jgi:hypothetical protein
MIEGKKIDPFHLLYIFSSKKICNHSRLFFESNFYTHAWIGIDAGALYCIPVLEGLSDLLMLFPVYLTLIPTIN